MDFIVNQDIDLSNNKTFVYKNYEHFQTLVYKFYEDLYSNNIEYLKSPASKLQRELIKNKLIKMIPYKVGKTYDGIKILSYQWIDRFEVSVNNRRFPVTLKDLERAFKKL